MQSYLILSLVALSCYGKPLETEVIMRGEILDDGSFLIDDMVLSEDEFHTMFPHETTLDTNVTLHKRYGVEERNRWPNGRIPYEFQPDLPGSKDAVLAGFKEYEQKTCLKFVPRTSSDKAYMYVTGSTNKPRCAANTGYNGRMMRLFLNRGCYGRKTILHEIGHGIGLHHEHIHPDMANKVKILWGNADPAKHPANWKNPSSDAWPVAYDPTSVMHYGPHAFVKSGCKNADGSRCKSFTMSEGPDQFGRGKNGGLSDGDVANVKYMYKCPK